MKVPAYHLTDRHGRVLLDTASFDLAEGEVLAVTGPSGAGKSLFTNALFGWVGKGHEAVLSPNDGACLMIQDPSRGLTPGMRMGTHFREVIRGGGWRKRALALCRELGMEMPDLLDRVPGTFSGGEKQRLMLALVLAREPHVLVCDEPAASLDAAAEQTLWQTLMGLRASRGITLIFVTHQLELIRAHADRVLFLRAGRAVFTGTRAAFFDAPRDPAHKTLIDHHCGLGNQVEAPTVSATPPLLEIDSFCLRYGNLTVFDDFHWSIGSGDWCWLLGPSGSGKTSLARFICGLNPDGQGTVRLAGQTLDTDLRRRSRPNRRAIGYLFQHGSMSFNPARTVASRLYAAFADDRSRLSEMLDALDLTDLELDRRPATFSVGQRQRLNLIHTLSVSPRLLILDELFSGLDLIARITLTRFLQSFQSEGMSILAITHDVALTRWLPAQRLVLVPPTTTTT